MKAILILYIIIVNLAGFLMMGIDKRRARKRRWRIPERTLFLTALLFGSIGILTGMYVFRHKTRHLSFAIGIPTILVIQLLLISFLFSWNSRRMGSPSQAVENELTLIQNLDSDTIQTFVSYENLMNSHLSSGTIGDETSKAVELFFKNFRYSIHNEQIQGDSATVSVNITNGDMKALAQDLCAAMVEKAVIIYPDDTSSTTSDYYQLLYDTLSTHTYEPVVTTARFHLKREESGWTILADETLEDELVSGFISYMNDPYLLPASRVLSLNLEALKDLTASQWKTYLAVEDVFATYNTDYYQSIDQEYVNQLASYFDYEILRCQEEGDTATAAIRITSLDMPGILSAYKKSLLKYAASTKSIRDNDVQISNEASRLLLEALQENTSSSSTDVELTFSNNGTTWEVYFDNEFINAVMGDMAEAIDTFNSITKEFLSGSGDF